MTNTQQVVFARRIACVLIRVASLVWLSQVIWHLMQDVVFYFPDDYSVSMMGGPSFYEVFLPSSFFVISIMLWLIAPWGAKLMVPLKPLRCPKCRYRLEGAPVDRCPDCGLYLGPDFMDPPSASSESHAE